MRIELGLGLFLGWVAACSLTNSPGEPSLAGGGQGDGGDGAALLCGNGELDEGETCDPAEDCPSSCDDDGDECTSDDLTGSPDTCDARCEHSAITSCGEDGCCVAGCDLDPDCCGNGAIDGDELCDGDCPSDCNDTDVCTGDQLVGSPATCDAACVNDPITDCTVEDGCCPEGCSSDPDCTAKVALVAADSDGVLNEVQEILSVFPELITVDAFNAGDKLVELSTLQNYDVALVWSNDGFADAVKQGNVLADYFDAGGRVVAAGAAFVPPYDIKGKFGSQYTLFALATDLPPTGQTMLIVDPQHPTTAGLTTLKETGSFACHSNAPAKTGTAVSARWTDSVPLAVYGTVEGRQRVDLNLTPGPNTGECMWEGDGARLLRNALMYK